MGRSRGVIISGGVALGLIAAAAGFRLWPMPPERPSVPEERPAATMPVAAPAEFPAFAPAWPLTLPAGSPDRAKEAPNPVPATWSTAEIDAARARCTSLLEGIAAVAVAEPAFRRGACGAPAPIRLVSLGTSPEVALSPPALVTCDMALALSTWLERDIQPLARSHLGAEIVSIETMSDYACRNAYGRAKARLSEHSRANALDIRGFRTSKGETAALLSGWGMTARDARARVASGTLGAFVTTVEAAPAMEGGGGAPMPDLAAGVFSEVFGAQGPSLGLAPLDLTPAAARGEPALSWLGGPGAAAEGRDKLGGGSPGGAPDAPSRRAEFLRAAHRSACHIFGTVLGPEADSTHRNHIHVDMAARGSGSYCE